ncbi:MAG TPA: HAMP domain-containing sensor histidine kinase [Candidatus Limnocylindrales bacterium]|nr:HAMP domain-containing sensor histidine kinase [Candidatus Limnocylindrales bacterium]
MTRFMPRFLTGLRARLVVGFLAVVTIALILVFATLPGLLNGYFEQQTQDDLKRRTGTVWLFVVRELLAYQSGDGGAPRPLLQPTNPVTVADGVSEALGTPDSGVVRELAQEVAQANVTVTIASSPETPDDIVYELHVPLGDERGLDGQQREPISETLSVAPVPDLFYTQAGAGAPERVVTVELSEPFTFRAQSIESIIRVMAVAAIIALIVAVIVSIFIAERLSNPIRRLTSAARELSEGHLDTRVTPPSNSREMAELTNAFNSMAERVQESIEFIRRDRDRSRDFLADVSHELRTPIAALRTFNELLAEGAVEDEVTEAEFLDQSRQQIERLDWLATNLLELSKLESGLVLLDLRPDDLRAVVENAIQQAQPSADRKGVKLVMNVPDKPIRQRHDPQRLGQVVGNLIGNAIKFTPSGGQVDVTLTSTKKGAELLVADTGVGINAAELPFVFERFYRGAEANESRAAGSGLGLSIVRSIVEMHNGRVAITSTPGKGTQVSVALPRDVSVSSPAPVRA